MLALPSRDGEPVQNISVNAITGPGMIFVESGTLMMGTRNKNKK
jgi:hypothetical protein